MSSKCPTRATRRCSPTRRRSDELRNSCTAAIARFTSPILTAKPAGGFRRGFRRWPRIVLGLYEAELAIAQNDRKQNGVTRTGTPSDIAYDEVGRAVGLGLDRVRDLCREGRRHLKHG